MKLAFFSDAHGNFGAFNAFLRDVERRSPDTVIFGGDVFGYYYHQDEILTSLRSSGFTCLLGNHDSYFLELIDGKREVDALTQKYGSSYIKNLADNAISDENISFLRGLRPSFELSDGDCRIAAFHGSPNDTLEGRIYPDTVISDASPYEKYDYVLLGHTHHKLVRRVGNCVILNSGSIGQQRDGRGCSYLMLDTDSGKFDFFVVEYDLKPLLSEIRVYDADKEFLSSVLTRKPNGETPQ